MSQIDLPESNAAQVFFKENLIPTDAHLVRTCMQCAGEYGVSENIFLAHVVSSCFACLAVVFSAINVVPYALQCPFKILYFVVRLDPEGIVYGILADATDIARSLLFVSLGIAFIAGGIIFPAEVFDFLAPCKVETPSQREIRELKNENEELRITISTLRQNLEKLTKRKNSINNLNDVEKNN